VYANAFGPGLMVIMVMMMMVLVLVMVMVMVMVMVSKVLSQVGWPHQCHYQSINRLKASIGQSFHKLRDQAAQ
jgi:hypothetical protein